MKKHATHYKLILPLQSLLTKAILLNKHQQNQYGSAPFTRMLANEQFYIPKPTVTCKLAIKDYSRCRIAVSSMTKLEPSVGSIKDFRKPKPMNQNKNEPYNVCYFD